MQFESFRRDTPTINLSALIDVIFILLIFVVLAANFDRLREMNVILPSAESTSAANPEAVIVTVPAEGPMLLFDEPIEADALGPKLAELRATHEALLLVSDGRVPLDRAVAVFDQAAEAGFTSVSIATQKGAK